MSKINARVEAVENRVTQLHQWFQELNADHMELRAATKKDASDISQKLEQISRKLEVIGRINPSSSHGREGSARVGTITVKNEPGNSNSIPIQKPTEISPNLSERRRMMEFPRFSGENPRSWFRKCRNYFLFCPTPENEKVLLASMYMEGKAEFFYMDYVEGKDHIGWERFSEMVFERFGDPCGENVDVAFHNLQQEGSVEMYIEKFEELKAFIMVQENTKIAEEHFVASFLNGLKQETRDVVQNLRPATLTRAIQLAKLQEMGVEHLVKKLFEEAMVQREKEGLCFNCDEPDSYGHECKKSYEEEEVEESSSEPEEDSRASFHSVAVANTPNPSLIKGWVKKDSISLILVSGSSHSFLDPQAAQRLGCKLEQTKPFSVSFLFGSGTECNSKCSGFKWKMGGVEFTADVRIMELGWYGCDLVLGRDFLNGVGGIEIRDDSITITHQGKRVVLLTGYGQ